MDPVQNRCWFAGRVLEVKRAYGFTVDPSEAAVNFRGARWGRHVLGSIVVNLESTKRPRVLARPYSERQMIVVTDDKIVDAMEKAEREASRQKRSPSVADIAIRLLLPTEFVIEAAIEGIKALIRAQEKGIRILQIGNSEAVELVFPPGHPRETVLYVGHPAKPEVYYTIADFHRITFEHKFSEAINLLMHLGATSIRVEHLHGWSREFSSRLSVALGEASTRVKGEVGKVHHSGNSLLYEAKLTGTTKAKVPESLVWYPHEPTWQSIAKGRMEFGLQQFTLNIAYEDDYGVNAGLKVGAQKVGLDLGGRFEDHEATTWKIAGDFRELE